MPKRSFLLEKIFHFEFNTFNHENKGTLITSNANEVGIKTLSVLENSLSKSRRKRILGKTGVDARIF
jgi:aspartokinase/homoserine dehydrogenase 1